MNEPEGYGLIMPFVVCRSKDGPYEDDSFVAGYQAGRADSALAAIAAVEGDGLTLTTYPDLVPQLELIAMRHGFHHTETKKVLADPDDPESVMDSWVTWSCSRWAPAEETP